MEVRDRHSQGRTRYSVEPEDDYGSRDNKRKDERRRYKDKSSKYKGSAQSFSRGGGAPRPSHDLPPRFLNKQSRAPRNGVRTYQTVNKKPPMSKDTNKWQQQPSTPSTPSSSPHLSQQYSPSQQQPHPNPLLHHTYQKQPILTNNYNTAHGTINVSGNSQSCDINTTHDHDADKHRQHQNSRFVGTGNRDTDDGGWSSGIPEKGSGWRGSAGMPSSTTVCSNWGSSLEAGDTESGTSGWGDGSNPSVSKCSLDKHGAIGDSSWLSVDNGTGVNTNRPLAIGTDGWRTNSPKQGSPQNDVGMWNCESEDNRSQSPGGLIMLAPSSEQKRKHENGMNPKSAPPLSSNRSLSPWGSGTRSPGDMMGTNWKPLNGPEHHDSPVGVLSQQQGESLPIGTSGHGRQEVEWEGSDKTSVSSNDWDTCIQNYDSNRTAISPSVVSHSETLRDGGQGEIQVSGNLPTSYDGHMTLYDNHMTTSNDTDNFDPEQPYSRISPCNRAGTPIQGVRSGGATPIQGGAKATEGGVVGENCWRSGRMNMGSTSSMNSVGSNSSWNGGGFPSNSNSPRKMSRFDRSPSQHSGTTHCDSNDSSSNTGNHTSSSTLSSSSMIHGLSRNYPRKLKQRSTTDLEDGLDSLYNQPSGWGELPSPKPSDLDNGTEFWGVPPDDLERQVLRDKSRMSHSSTSADIGSGGVEWDNETVTCWGGNSGPANIPGTLIDHGTSEWGSYPSINKQEKSFSDNVMQLMDMGLPRPNAEKLLKSTNNDLDMAFLLAASEDPNSEIINTSSAFPMKGVKKQLKVPTTLSIGTPFSSGLGQNKDGHQLGNMPPNLSSQSQSQVQNQLKLLQMQQQFLLNQCQIGNLQYANSPSLPLNLQNYHQVLTQRLAQLQKKKQSILTQQHKLGGGGGVNTPSNAHQIHLKLQQVQQAISQINQELLLISQLSGQQKELSKSQDLSGLGSPIVGGLSAPPTARGKGFNMKQGLGRSQSTSGMSAEEVMDTKELMYNLQGLSLGNAISQSSARSVSRLHQIISGSSSNENLVGLAGGGGHSNFSSGGSQGSSPFSPPQGNNGISLNGMGNESTSSSVGTPSTSSSSPFLSTGKSFGEIQEFRPGVPWQPRMQATEPAQLYSKQNSVPSPNVGGSIGLHDHYLSMPQSPICSNLSSPMVETRSFTSGDGINVPSHKYMRSNSTGSWFYGGGGGGTFGKRLASPSSLKFAHYSAESPSSTIKYIHHAEPSNHHGGGWNGSSGSMSSESSGGGFGGSTHTRTYYPSRTRPSVQSPVSMGTQFAVGGSDVSAPLWNHQQQHNSSHVTGNRRMIVPPSSLTPRPIRGGVYNSSRSMHGNPLGTRAMYASKTPTIPPHSHSDDRNWKSLASTPAILTPSSTMISNSVWGSNSLSTPDDPTSIQLQHDQWGRKNNVSKIWNQTLESNTGVVPSKPPGLPVNPDPSLVYMQSSHTTRNPTVSAEDNNSFVTTPSLSSGSSMWGQDELGSSQTQKEVLSPEPTFAEWQAGKKARLSVFKLPSNMPTSPWLVIRNITTQINSASLRDVCGEYGIVKVCYIYYPSEFAIICFCSTEEAIQAKTGLDKSPSISGVLVSAQFASESNIKEICEQLQINIGTEQQQENKGWSGAIEKSNPTSIQTSSSLTNSSAQWESDNPGGVPYPSTLDNPFTRQTSEMSVASTPGSSSMWSEGGFLSSFSSSWYNFSSGSGEGSMNLTVPSRSSSTASPPESSSGLGLQNANNVKSLLPDGLL